MGRLFARSQGQVYVELALVQAEPGLAFEMVATAKADIAVASASPDGGAVGALPWVCMPESAAIGVAVWRNCDKAAGLLLPSSRAQAS